jgi:competence protein ComEA
VTDLLRPIPRLSWRDRIDSFASWAALARLATGAGALLVAAAGAWWLLREPPPPVEAALPRAAPVSTAAALPGPAPGLAPVLVVQAAGAVATPGVYRLPGGSRVDDLVRAAGGPAPEADLEALPLAALLVDGQRVYVPRQGEAVPMVPGDAPAGTAAGPIDVNTATAEQLEQLPGVGPTIAAAIVNRRERAGRFATVDDLLDVPGIGPRKLETLRALVRV